MRTFGAKPTLLLSFSLLLIIGFALRVIGLGRLPASLNLDEATNGLDAILLIRHVWLTPFLQNNFGRETLFFYGQGLALQLFGISIFSLRFGSVLAGMLTVPLMYVAGKRLRLDDMAIGNAAHSQPRSSPASSTDQRASTIALLAATGLTISYWHVYFSRLGLRAILLPPLLLALVSFFWRGWPGTMSKRGSRGYLIGAGILLGMSFYVYLAARLLPLIFLIFIAVDLIQNRSAFKQKLINLFLFGLITVLVTLPLAIYFRQNPQAFGSRTQAISVLADSNPLEALSQNMISLLQIHFVAGTWLGQWPALNLLTALGLLVGLIVCLFHVRKPATFFLILWWGIGTAPVLFSIQNWSGQTTLLRGVVAWPALFLISAIGLIKLAHWLYRFASRINVPPFWPQRQPGLFDRSGSAQLGLFWLLLILGSLTTGNHYFAVWATTYDRLSDHPPQVARYLNHQTDRLTLTPLDFYAETVAHFLLQDNYPRLTNVEPDELDTLLAADRPTIYVLPHASTAESTFVLLAPAIDGRGTAYLLPPLSPDRIEALSNQTKETSPIDSILDGEQEPIAQVYRLPAEADFLPDTSLQAETASPLKANFNRDVLLSSFQVEPASLKPGDTVTLTINWQARQPIDGDYNLFIHLFDLAQGQRHGQINAPLTGILFEAHRWPPNLTIPGIYSFTLPPDAPEGVYRFEVGLYHAASLERLPVTLETDQSGAVDDKVILGKLQVWQQPPAPPRIPLTGTQFGDTIALLGVDLPTGPVQPGQVLTYTLHWQALASIPDNYTVFTHLLDTGETLRAQQDNAPQQGRYPTSEWDAGELIIDPYTLPLPQDLAPGQYTLRVGLYRPETGQRLFLKNQAQDFVDLPSSITIRN